MKLPINSIINEEINKFLNEGQVISDDRFTFKQRLNNSTFYNYDSFSSEFDSDITESDIIVTWKAGFWVSDFGIENFIINVIGVEGSFLMKLYDKQTDELTQEAQKNINEIQWKFIMSEASLPVNGSLEIYDLEFNFTDKICKINF